MSAGSNPAPPTALAPPEENKKKRFPLDRIILLALLLVVVVLVVIDYRARFAYKAALQQVVSYLPESEEAADLNPIDFEAVPTQEQIEAMIGQPPDEDSRRSIDVGVVEETYSWRGIFRTFAFRVQYRKFRDELRLERVASVVEEEKPAEPAEATDEAQQ